jgi:hypothetical protein
VWLLLKLQLQLLWGPSIIEENEPERRLELANTKGYACGLRVSVRLGTCACVGLGIGIWKGVVITLLDGVRECAREGSCNASLDNPRGGGGKTGGQGVQVGDQRCHRWGWKSCRPRHQGEVAIAKRSEEVSSQGDEENWECGGGPGSILAAVEGGYDASGGIAGVLNECVLRQMGLTTHQCSSRCERRDNTREGECKRTKGRP